MPSKNQDSRNFWMGWFPFWVYGITVFILAAIPGTVVEKFFKFQDKCMHAGEFLVLFLLSVNAFRRSSAEWLSAKPYASALILAVVMGVATEWMQLYVPMRSADVLDFAADLSGALIAFVLYRSFSPGVLPAH